MGYNIRQVDGKWSTILGQEKVALAALRALAKSSRDPYAIEVAGKARHLDEAVAGWNFNATLGPCESANQEQILSLGFVGEKFTDQDTFLATLAPFSIAGSFVEFVGEDGERFRYVVRADGKLKEQRAEVSWVDRRVVE